MALLQTDDSEHNGNNGQYLGPPVYESPAEDKSKVAVEYAGTLPADIDLSLAANPIGCSPTINFAATAAEVSLRISKYPQYLSLLTDRIAEIHNVDPGSVYVGNGAVGIIEDLFNNGFISQGQVLVTPEATFPVPAALAKNRQIGVLRVPLKNNYHYNFDNLVSCTKKAQLSGLSIGAIFLCNPNNPTGLAEPSSEIIKLAKTFPELWLLVSEANIDFIHPKEKKKIGTLLDSPPLPTNVIVLRSFSKSYGLANMRVGYAIGDNEAMSSLRQNKVPFHVPDLNAAIALQALNDPEHVERSRVHMSTEVPKLIAGLNKLDFPCVTDSVSNIILARIPIYFKDAQELADKLRKHNVSIVCCGKDFGKRMEGQHIRLTPSTTENNEKFLGILEKVCAEATKEQHAAIEIEIERSENSKKFPRRLKSGEKQVSHGFVLASQ